MIKYAIAIVFCFMLFAWLGCKKDSTTFHYLESSLGDTVTLSGVSGRERADSAYKSVFLDFSTAVQSSALRSSWDLGFYCGSEFRVIINHAVGATAAVLDKSNLNDVTIADTVALVSKFNLDVDTAGDISTVDPVDADSAAYLAGTVIPEIPAAASSSRVILLNRGTATNLGRRNWIKMKITRANSGYTVTWGNIEDTAEPYNTFTMTKDASYTFRYRSFTSGVVTYEPAKTLWDIAWGLTTYKDVSTGTTKARPVPDFMMINFINGVKAAEVKVTETTTFDNFSEAQLAGITFSGYRDVIGVNWRNLTLSSTGALSINTDRFYLVQDKTGNVYKVSFAGGGSRGYPVVWYIRVKKAPDPAG
ncbi:MAG: HmuY family protein [Pedobacter sp.]|uniref:HmuY family protein n=1 Tax=Pedobacter sp. TaxID=1411316 RepID=UPI003394189B